MSITPSIVDIPADPTIRRHWVTYQLRARGDSFHRIARREGCSVQAVSQALMLPSAHLERAIAEAIGVPVEKLFPERFLPTGERIPRTRQGNTALQRRNVKRRRVA